MYVDKMTVHRNRLREMLAGMAEDIHIVLLAMGKMATALDNVDVCQKDLDSYITDMHERLRATHSTLDDFDASVGGLPKKK